MTNIKTDYFKSHDGKKLFFQECKSIKSRAVIIIVHGLGEHSGRYQAVTRYLVKNGYHVYCYDHRGHGRSDGHRNHVEDFSDYLRDLDLFTEFVTTKNKAKPVFILGHSMGGQIVLNYIADFQPPISGMITSSANIVIAKKTPFLKRFLALKLARILPRFSLSGELDPKHICRDDKVVEEYISDPLVSPKVTLALAAQLILNQDTLMAKARHISIPSLILHGGDDKICAAQGSINFFNRLSSADKTLKIYDEFYHEILNELGKEEVFSDIIDWLDSHIKNQRTGNA